MLKKIAMVVAAAVVAQAASASSIDFHGYMRSQVGGTTQGGNLQCFKLNWDANAKYRLGNECDSYGEVSFTTKLAKNTTGGWANYNLRLALKEAASADHEAGSNFEIASRENFVQAGGIMGDGFLKDAKVWLGKRFYNRNDMHINDYYYWASTGQGAGIEDISLGGAKFAYAFHQNGGNEKSGLKRNEFRFYDIPLWTDGKLEAAVELFTGSSINKKTTDADESDGDKTGSVLTVQWNQGNIMGGFNKLAVQVANGHPAQGTWTFGGYSAQPDVPTSQKSFRIYEQLMVSPTDDMSGQAVFVYENTKNSNGSKKTWLSIGARGLYNVTPNFGLALEVGHDRANLKKSSSGEGDERKPNLTKITFAPQLTVDGGFWARPVFRTFVTYAKWNADAVGQVDGAGIFGSKKNGISYGAQVEAWW